MILKTRLITEIRFLQGQTLFNSIQIILNIKIPFKMHWESTAEDLTQSPFNSNTHLKPVLKQCKEHRIQVEAQAL